MSYKTYACFSGADIFVYVNNKVYGEIQNIYINTKTKELAIKTALFNSLIESHEDFTHISNSKILVVFLNEYGNKMYRVFDGVEFSHEEVEYSIDKLIMHNSFICTFEDSGSYKHFDVSVNQLREDTFNIATIKGSENSNELCTN